MSVAAARPRSHLAFERLIGFDLRLTTLTGLHIGAGKNPALVGSEMPVLRDAAGRPLIPGSSLRGVLRSTIAGLVETLRLDRRRPLVASAPRPSGIAAADWDRFTALWNERMGLVERLFGRAPKSGEQSYASRLFLSDLRPTGEVVTELRDGVGIDRDTRTAASEGGVKFDLEVVPADIVFEGTVRLHDPEDHEVGLVAQALWMLDRGLVRLGGKSARGLGQVAVGIGPVEEVTAESLLFGSGAPRKGDAQEADQVFDGVAQRLGGYIEKLRELARREEDAPSIASPPSVADGDAGPDEE